MANPVLPMSPRSASPRSPQSPRPVQSPRPMSPGSVCSSQESHGAQDAARQKVIQRVARYMSAMQVPREGRQKGSKPTLEGNRVPGGKQTTAEDMNNLSCWFSAGNGPKPSPMSFQGIPNTGSFLTPGLAPIAGERSGALARRFAVVRFERLRAGAAGWALRGVPSEPGHHPHLRLLEPLLARPALEEDPGAPDWFEKRKTI